MIVWVFGSRGYSNSACIFERLEKLPRGTRIVTGGADGADHLAELAARKLKFKVSVELAEWKKYGRSAGPKRNKKIAEEYYPDLALAFWDGESKGTKGSIDLCIEYGIDLEIKFN